MSALLAKWRSDPLGFIERELHDPVTGKPFVLLPAERDFLSHLFTFTEDGRLRYPEAVYAAPKKSGKTTFAAIVVITLLLLYGGRFAEAIACANDFEQSVGRVFEMVRRIVEASPLLAADAKITGSEIKLAGTTITPIPSNFASAAGADPAISVFDELWGYASERARRLFDELVPPPTRKIALRLTVSYAGFTGESVLLEELYQRGLDQPEIAPSLHAGDGILMAWHHEPVAPWQTEGWRADMRRSLRPNQYARMIENRFVTSESSFVEMSAWDTCVDPKLGHMIGDRALPCWAAAVDASVKHDSTALALVSFDKATQQVRLCDHRIVVPSPDKPIDFAAHVEQTLLDWHDRFLLRAVYYDPFQMAAVAQRLAKLHLPMREFPQTIPNLTAMAENLFDLIKGRNLLTYADEAIRTAIARSIAVEGARGWKISKERQSHRIDITIALGMAALAAIRSMSEPVPYIRDYSRWVGDMSDEGSRRSWQMMRRNLYIGSGGLIRIGNTGWG
jgi:phage terminase large subunit-like protein